ncbi:MBL fold metallo-hydrolase [Dehalococcoides mccartyi]|nr:MBL fold metallo-hydrolase [Dehalococcoides mccartyi]
MEIKWLGHSCFRLKGKNTTIITDPFPLVSTLLARLLIQV